MATIPNTQKFHTVKGSVDTVERGSAQFSMDRDIYTMQDILDTVVHPGSGVAGASSIYVPGTGTATENGTALIAGYADAVAKIAGAIASTTLILGPGDYTLPSSLVINDKVSVVSLTGQQDVVIDGFDVQVSSGANFTSTLIAGLKIISTYRFIVDTALANITVKNVLARGQYSFDSASAGGNLSGTFIDCTGGVNSFGSRPGSNASGTFIGCDARTASALSNGKGFGSTGTASGYFKDCGSRTSSMNFGWQAQAISGYFINCVSSNYSFGYSATNVTGQFNYCTAEQQSFGYDGDTVSGKFYHCIAGDSSFGSSVNTSNSGQYYGCISTGTNSFGSGSLENSGQYHNCTSGSGSFGSNSTGTQAQTTNAAYYNCIAEGSGNFGSHANPAGTPTIANSFYMGCKAYTDSFGKGSSSNQGTYGVVYNCRVEANPYAPVAGSGKIRNSIDNSYNLINQG
jgi:hypothetical protein